MKYYRLMWNPDWWPPKEKDRKVVIEADVLDSWTRGITKSFVDGDRFFLYRCGKEPKGIVASGKIVLSEEFKRDKRVHGRTENELKGETGYVGVIFDDNFDPISDEPLIPDDELKQIPSEMHIWQARNPAIIIQEEIGIEIDRRLTQLKERRKA